MQHFKVFFSLLRLLSPQVTSLWKGTISQATTSGLATVQPIKYLNQKCKADADNYLFVSDKQR